MGYGHWTYERLMGVLNGQKEYKLSRVLTVTREAASAIIYYGNHRLIEYHKDGRIRIHSVGEKRKWGGSCAKVNEVLGWGYRVYHHHDRSKAVKSRWIFMVCKGADWSKYPRYEIPTYDPLTINPDGTITVETAPAVRFDRDAEMAKARAERAEKRAKVNQFKRDAIKALKRAGLQRGKFRIKLNADKGETPVWINAWIKGQLAIHPNISTAANHRANWADGLVISHSCGLRIFSADTVKETLGRFQRARKVEGKISLYLTLRKLELDKEAIEPLYAEIREALYAA